MINIQEREAKQKVCPFLRENCKGSMCLSWKKVGKLEWQKILRIKAEFRLSKNEKTIKYLVATFPICVYGAIRKSIYRRKRFIKQ